jgi:hypothetical protein
LKFEFEVVWWQVQSHKLQIGEIGKLVENAEEKMVIANYRVKSQLRNS